LFCAGCSWDPDLVPQDEWLYTPILNLESANTDLRVEFYINMSYYWGVFPNNNYDIELWISTDGGTSFPTKLWDESALGEFESWSWYGVTIDLSDYAGEGEIVLAWRYFGVDGATASIDLVSIIDDPYPTGRCCYGNPVAPDCNMISEPECNTIGGNWDESLSCSDPCPPSLPGDDCLNPISVILPAAIPYIDIDSTCGRGNDYTQTCLGNFDGGEDIIYELTVTESVDMVISLDPFGTGYTGILIDDNCPPDDDCIIVSTRNSGDHSIAPVHLEPGTYFIMIDTWPSPDCIPQFELKIDPPGEIWQGDDCGFPFEIKTPDDIPYSHNHYTCGHIDFYDQTCLGSYDGGEDVLYELSVDVPINLYITLFPKGTGWTGFLLDDDCPPDPGSCIAISTSSSGHLGHSIISGLLDPGVYYIMVDTWPSPDCIPDYELTVYEIWDDFLNDWCYNPEYVGDVVDYWFSTVGASLDGDGPCMTSPNIWYCYTAPCDGITTVSLCGSNYDTKLAVYDGCSCDPLPEMLGCNDDAMRPETVSLP
jgi:hypothetical protein